MNKNKYTELSWMSTESSDYEETFFIVKPGVHNTVKSCEPLEIFESIVTDEIIDHVATNSNLYATQSLGNKDLVIKSHPDCIDGKISLLLKFDCILQH